MIALSPFSDTAAMALGYGADVPGVDQLAVDRGLSAYRFEPTALDKCPQ